MAYLVGVGIVAGDGEGIIDSDGTGCEAARQLKRNVPGCHRLQRTLGLHTTARPTRMQSADRGIGKGHVKPYGS